MTKKSIGFIGGGRIVRIFLEGWQRAGQLPAKVVVSDCNAETLAKVKARFPSVETAANSATAAAQDIVFLAVHPPVMADVVGGIKGSVMPGALVVSLAPKVPLAKLTELFGGFARLARVLPNAPSVINQGFNPVAFSPALTVADKADLMGLLVMLGECPEVAETKLDAYALVTARGPAFLWFQFYELCQVAQAAGLTAEEAQVGLERMLAGAAHTMRAVGLDAEGVRDLIPMRPLAELEPQISAVYRAGFGGGAAKAKT